MGKIFAIVNQNGGVGKTTTTSYLAKAFTAKQKKVLIIDLDPLSSLSSNYDFSSLGTKSLTECMEGRATLNECIFAVEENQLFMALGGKCLIGFEIAAIYSPNREKVLSTLLSSIKGNYDYILIDTPSSLGLLSMNALTAADEVIIPLRCDVRIFEGMAELLRTINDVNNTLNPQLTIAGFLVTHVNRELRSTHVNLKEIHTCYGNKVFQTLIPNNDDLLVYYKQFATELSA
ncbi:MAG: AAA family ATPase [Bacteroidaceae bacterium]|nr:AAA family ATPase [Bacteroidaceae bacterium]